MPKHYPYPVPADVQHAAPTLALAIRGQVPDVKEAAHAAYVVAGYGLSMFPGAPAEHAEPQAMTNYTLDEAAHDCERLAQAVDPSQPFDPDAPQAFIAIPWATLVPMLFELIRVWMSNRSTDPNIINTNDKERIKEAAALKLA